MNHTTTSNKAYYAQVIFLALVIGIGLQIAQAWTGPGTGTPPNTSTVITAPITTSNVDQVKSGGLSVSNLLATGAVQASSLKMTTGAGAGKVLTSDASGNASWQAASSGGGLGYGQSWHYPYWSCTSGTNSTSKPIMINMMIFPDGSNKYHGWVFYVSGVLAAYSMSSNEDTNYLTASIIVPPGASWSSSVVNTWSSLLCSFLI